MNNLITWLSGLEGWQLFLFVYSIILSGVFLIFGWIVLRVFYFDISLNERDNKPRGN